MTPEDELQLDIQKGFNTATIGMLRFLMAHLALQQPPESLTRLNSMFNNMRHDAMATKDLGLGGLEAYNQAYDHVEGAMIEIINRHP